MFYHAKETIDMHHQNFSKKEIKTSAFTLIELLVVVAIISLLVSILLPSLSTARDLAKSAVCKVNLRSQSTAIQMYASDYYGKVPRWNAIDYPSMNSSMQYGYFVYFNTWTGPGLLYRHSYIDNPELYYCPMQKTPGFTYEYYANTANGNLYTAHQTWNAGWFGDSLRSAYLFRIPWNNDSDEDSVAWSIEDHGPQTAMQADVFLSASSMLEGHGENFVNTSYIDSHVESINDKTIYETVYDAGYLSGSLVADMWEFFDK